jgi:hypothetical protein
MSTIRLIFALLVVALTASMAFAQSPSTVQQNAFSYTTTGTMFANLSLQCGSGNQAPIPPGCANQTPGTIVYCKDCNAGVNGACVGGGTGIFAKRLASSWKCADVNVTAGSDITNYHGPVSIMGNNTNGSDRVGNINVNGVLNVMTFGADSTGAVDSTTAIQNTVNAACPTPYNGGHLCTAPILFPPGKYTVSQMNLTNLWGLTLGSQSSAYGNGNVTINCNEATNNTGVCLDMSGDFYNHMDGLSIQGVSGHSPKTLVLLGKTTAINSQGFTWRADTFLVTTGDWGLYNYGGEVFHCMDCNFNGTPNKALLMISVANTPGMSSPFTTLVTPPTSMTVVSFDGTSAWGTQSGTPIMFDTGTGILGPVHLAGYCNSPSGVPCITDYSSADTGQIEQLSIGSPFRYEPQGTAPSPLFVLNWSNINGATFHAQYGPTVSTSTPAVWLKNGGTSSTINVQPADGQPNFPNPVIECSPGVLGVTIQDYNATGGVNQINNCPGATEIGLNGIITGGHIGARNPGNGGAPTLSNCGTGAVFSAQSTDSIGEIQTGTGATNCTLNFHTPFANTPACVATDNGVNQTIYLSNRSQNSVTFNASAMASEFIDYFCGGMGGN